MKIIIARLGDHEKDVWQLAHKTVTEFLKHGKIDGRIKDTLS